MARLISYLFFDGKAKEAMEFYKEVFGGELDIQKIGDNPMGANKPAEEKENVMHSELTTENFSIMASDMMDEDGVKKGNTMKLCLDFKDTEELNAMFVKLSDGGTVGHPIKEEFWGTFGDCIDKYGTEWMFNFTKQN